MQRTKSGSLEKVPRRPSSSRLAALELESAAPDGWCARQHPARATLATALLPVALAALAAGPAIPSPPPTSAAAALCSADRPPSHVASQDDGPVGRARRGRAPQLPLGRHPRALDPPPCTRAQIALTINRAVTTASQPPSRRVCVCPPRSAGWLLASDTRGRIFVFDKSALVLLRTYDPSAVPSAAPSAGVDGLNSPHAMVASATELFIADHNNHRLQAHPARAHGRNTCIARPGQPPASLVLPRCLPTPSPSPSASPSCACPPAASCAGLLSADGRPGRL
eukprot:712399-Prymnesium_polylepis.1